MGCVGDSVPFAETLQNSCGTLVDGKGNPVVDGKSRLSPIAQDVLSTSHSDAGPVPWQAPIVNFCCSSSFYSRILVSFVPT